MSQESIVNRVAKSALLNIDLAEQPPKWPVKELDLSNFLEQGLILREKEFRAQLSRLDTTPFNKAYVRVFCSTEAIVPAWAYQLVATTLSAYANKVLVCDKVSFNLILWVDHIAEMDLSPYQNGLVLLKGCSDEKIPPSAYAFLAQRLTPVVKKLMFGEACSFVPLHKN
ncbi:MAG: DUF2480 family protein [Bacteroidetes bacterium]|nr:DUF2480 family protein [Bacteroidota bacterium]MDA1210369.1 DUF2480 family protein [Bacteroidota bacterium]